MKLRHESPRAPFLDLFYSVYINDLPIDLKEAILMLFEDETTLTVSGKTTRKVLEKAEIHLEALIKNGLSTNNSY